MLFSDFSVYIFLPFVLRSETSVCEVGGFKGGGRRERRKKKERSSGFVGLHRAVAWLWFVMSEKPALIPDPASFSSRPLCLLPPGEVHCGLLKATGRPHASRLDPFLNQEDLVARVEWVESGKVRNAPRV